MSKTNNEKTRQAKEQRELDTLAEILVILTKEYIENNDLNEEVDDDEEDVKKTKPGQKGKAGTLGVMVNVVFKHAYRAVEFLAQTKPLASVEAYNDFYKRTEGDEIRDIRKYNWFGRAKIGIDGKSIEIHKEYQWEHKTTAKMFKEELIKLCSNEQLTKEEVKEKIINLINKQEICWVTKGENDRLNKKKYRQIRPDGAYDEPEIDIKIQKPK